MRRHHRRNRLKAVTRDLRSTTQCRIKSSDPHLTVTNLCTTNNSAIKPWEISQLSMPDGEPSACRLRATSFSTRARSKMATLHGSQPTPSTSLILCISPSGFMVVHNICISHFSLACFPPHRRPGSTTILASQLSPRTTASPAENETSSDRVSLMHTSWLLHSALVAHAGQSSSGLKDYYNARLSPALRLLSVVTRVANHFF